MSLLLTLLCCLSQAASPYKPSTSPITSNTKNWVKGVSSYGVFVKNIDATWTTTDVNSVPIGWEVIYFDKNEGKYYRTKNRGEECDKYGDPLL